MSQCLVKANMAANATAKRNIKNQYEFLHFVNRVRKILRKRPQHKYKKCHKNARSVHKKIDKFENKSIIYGKNHQICQLLAKMAPESQNAIICNEFAKRTSLLDQIHFGDLKALKMRRIKK